MEISQFELIYKPQSPAPAAGAAVDRVIQGYFLEITNLEQVEYRYQLEFVAVPPAAINPERSLAGNTVVFIDVPGTDNQAATLNGSLSTSTFGLSTGFVRVPPLATALVAVLPSAFGPKFDPSPLQAPNFEVRGFVRIKLPAVYNFAPANLFPLVTRAQSTSPVKVLLTPQNRATFISASNVITGQTQASVPLATGTGLNQIPPERGGPLFIGALQPALTPRIIQTLEQNPDFASADVLAALLRQVDPANANLDAFNASMAEAGSEVMIARRAG